MYIIKKYNTYSDVKSMLSKFVDTYMKTKYIKVMESQFKFKFRKSTSETVIAPAEWPLASRYTCPGLFN